MSWQRKFPKKLKEAGTKAPELEMLEYILKNGSTFQRGTVKGVLREVSRELGAELTGKKLDQVARPGDQFDFFAVKVLGTVVLLLLLILATVSAIPSFKDNVASAGGTSYDRDRYSKNE